MLFVLYLLFAVPFFCAATAIGLTLTRFGEQSPQLYRADLVGGGIASAAIIGALFCVHPATALQAIAALGFLAAAFFHRRAPIVAVIGIAAVVIARPLPLRVSQFKELSHARRVPGARIVEERSSPLGLLTVVDSPNVPFRHAPGLSLTFGGEIPEQTRCSATAADSPRSRAATAISPISTSFLRLPRIDWDRRSVTSP